MYRLQLIFFLKDDKTLEDDKHWKVKIKNLLIYKYNH